MKAAHKFPVKMNSIHLDGSSMYVQGEYKNPVKNSDQIEKEPEPETSEMKPIEIVHGYSLLPSTRPETIYQRHDCNRRRRPTTISKNRFRKHRRQKRIRIKTKRIQKTVDI